MNQRGWPFLGAHVAIGDPGVRGWVRVRLAPPVDGWPRSLGLIETWPERGGSAEEPGAFTMRALHGALDGLLDALTAAREPSMLGEDPVALLTAGLADRPRHRKALSQVTRDVPLACALRLLRPHGPVITMGRQTVN